MLVLFTGLGFGMAGFKPVPAIIAAQAFNGFILPFIAIFLWMAINDKKLVKQKVNSGSGNVLFGIIVWVSFLLGSWNILRLFVNMDAESGFLFQQILTALMSFSLLLTLLVWFMLVKKRRV